MFTVGVMDEPDGTWDFNKLKNNVTTEASAASARGLSALSTVLLKNEGDVLPLPLNKKLAVIGMASPESAVVHAGGSGSVQPSYIADPLSGISNTAGAGASVVFKDGADLDAAEAAAGAADYAIVFVATLSGEGADRDSLSLDDGCGSCQGNPGKQNELVKRVAAANKKTIVVASVPGAVLMPWSQHVAAILTNFMPGQQAGNAIADVLFGKVNPSAKLPVTMPNLENEMNFTRAQWPGLPNPKNPAYAFYTKCQSTW